MCQIYYNNPGRGLFDFSEAYVYNDGSQSGCTGIGCESAEAAAVLNFAKNTGLIDEECFRYTGECLDDCSEYCGSPSQRVYIPNISNWEIDIDDNDELKQAIFDYGPIIMMPGTGNAAALHPGADPSIHHTVLFTGWSGSQWEIKDSWLGSPSIELKTYAVFSFQPHFYRVYPVDPQNSNDVLRCTGCQSGLFSRKGKDLDKDGFYS